MINQIILELKGNNHIIPTVDTGKVNLWAEWYKGNVRDIHKYITSDGKNNFEMTLKSMQMAKRVSEDWADLLLNEKTDIVLNDPTAQANLNKILRDTNFWVKANEGVERSFALGLGAFVLGVDDILIGNKGTINKTNAKLRIDFVDYFKINPITVENKIITECVFEVDNSDSTNYIAHVKNEQGNYVIYNYVYDKKNSVLNQPTSFDTKSSVAWFQILRPFIANNDIMRGYDIDLGISVFANAVDTLHALDVKYDSFDNEFIAGRKRIFVNEELWNVSNKNNDNRVEFNPLKSIFYKLQTSQGNGKVSDESGQLRATEHIEAINMELSILSDKVGFGKGYYQFDARDGVTATQVISENSNLYRNVKKHEILLEQVLYKLVEATSIASVNFTNLPVNINLDDDDSIRIMFDDSIIEDKGTELERDKGLVASNLMSPVEFRIKWMGEDEETATDNYRKYFKHILITNYLPALTSGAITPKQFVMEVYGVEDSEVISYIEDKLKQGGFQDFMDLYDGDET